MGNIKNNAVVIQLEEIIPTKNKVRSSNLLGSTISMDKELTIEEQVYYGNNAEIEMCDCCGYYYSILVMEYNGIQFLCNKCIN